MVDNLSIDAKSSDISVVHVSLRPCAVAVLLPTFPNSNKDDAVVLFWLDVVLVASAHVDAR